MALARWACCELGDVPAECKIQKTRVDDNGGSIDDLDRWFGIAAEIGNCGMLWGIHDLAVIFPRMMLWVDGVARSGPETMAVDEWLLETTVCPVLRVYKWKGDWASLGYFGKIEEARQRFPGLNLVRRWTGGGMVDHRCDWTYSLAVPKNENLAQLRGADSYLMIHEKLVKTIEYKHFGVEIVSRNQPMESNVCFENPVIHDLVDSSGQKLAGAGQRRSRSGLLHQGSVAGSCVDPSESQKRAEDFASELSDCWSEFTERPQPSEITMKMTARYDRLEWLNRR